MILILLDLNLAWKLKELSHESRCESSIQIGLGLGNTNILKQTDRTQNRIKNVFIENLEKSIPDV